METLTQTPADSGSELHLLTDWSGMRDADRSRKAGVLSVLAHAAAIVIFASLPASVMTPPPTEHHLLTPLVAPLTPLTQKEPNKNKVTGDFNAVEMQPKPRVLIPPTPPPRPPVAEKPEFVPPPPAMTAPPKVETRVEAPRLPDAPPPPPQIQPVEQPKLAFETPTAPPPPSAGPTGRVPMPSASVQDAIRGAVRGGASGVQSGSDSGIGEAVIQPRAPGSQASNLEMPELLFDLMGVDFRPYLTRLLSQVRRSWFAVWPESAKMGRRGRVAVQLRIGRNGEVLKVVFAQQSGVDALDRAAISGISAASPFGPLPAQFRGGEIRIQLNFAYNISR